MEDTSPLVRLEVPKGVLDLGKHLLNDAHVLRSIQVTNISDLPLNVNITSEDEDSVSFQLTNDNLADIPLETSATTSLQEESFNNVRLCN